MNNYMLVAPAYLFLSAVALGIAGLAYAAHGWIHR